MHPIKPIPKVGKLPHEMNFNISPCASRRKLPIACEVGTQKVEKVLGKRIKAHNGTLTAAVVVSCTEDFHEIVTASLDKTVAYWKIEKGDGLAATKIEGKRITLPGGPAFSLLLDRDRSRRGVPSVFCGTGRQGVVCWDPPADSLVPNVAFPSQSGWVRAMASEGKWILSCDCGNLRLLDTSWSAPRLVGEASLSSGDILGIAAQEKLVFTCATTGAIDCWEVGRTGTLKKSGSIPRAHDGRISSILLHKKTLISSGFDGSLKMWSTKTMDCLAHIQKAHVGKISSLAIDSDGSLLTGGDDGLIKQWTSKDLVPIKHPLKCHQSAVRVLATGRNNVLVSGDASGIMCVWETVSTV